MPIVGTYRAARRLENGEPNASWGDLAVNLAMDLSGARMIGSTAKGAYRVGKLVKALKANGFEPITREGNTFIKYVTKQVPINGGSFGTLGYKTSPEIIVKTIPEVDYTPAALAPLVQTLRVPATAPFKLKNGE